MRVFLDTNVLASSIATRGLCSELFESIIHEHMLLTCQPVLDELERVLADKFGLPEAVIAGFLNLLKTESQVVPTQKAFPVPVKDQSDISILACAIAENTEFFVTGDKELLDLKKIRALPIVSPRQFWLQLAGLENR